MKQKLLTDIELDVHELKYLMDSFTKEPTPTLSELLKRSITRMQGRLDELQQEVDAVQVISPSAVEETAEEEDEVAGSEEDSPVIIQSLESVVVKEDEEGEAIVAEEKPVVIAAAAETAAAAEEEEEEEEEEEGKKEEPAIVEEPVVETVVKEEEPKSAVLGESLKLSAGLRHAISLNDSFRFSRELFGGNTDLMNRVIEQISVMSSYKTAVAFLSSKVELNEEKEAVNDFLELLKKYFNQSV
ncbi:Uncharacterised protein [Bacteroides ovatus]|uniref:Uncharacterized protein n=1 Tax=Bacteroides ovatus (strain ATCC 8483 / DSM 1896 / JCM 5824 / BCRC 10623 / CCUG 4943 / NCTC 11153) TaxID=411476 RepID=A0AAN3A6Z3_BACO1|nr:hypothetical protein [Bacteroides ovatus]ALJ46968.1 hypothetical protein Bovatus_02335 [Bacteroides ovatus]EDO11169.1 hypothetical protein BACOVA_03072 [Bacteroides ovatus ATCC 8483]PQL36803.1 hypothetical protein C5Z02_25950 [Bacteroides ovatus]PQL44739.1 hypothetical protein C5Z02_23530 [Bacteroides ovatus]QRQ58483.1 hypothetical protein I6J65_09940 [Bacteroides ovatus]